MEGLTEFEKETREDNKHLVALAIIGIFLTISVIGGFTYLLTS